MNSSRESLGSSVIGSVVLGVGGTVEVVVEAVGESDESFSESEGSLAGSLAKGSVVVEDTVDVVVASDEPSTAVVGAG